MNNAELRVKGLTIDEWMKLETKRQKGSFWGAKYSFKPVCAKTKIGDGNQLIYFGTIDQRPYYWLIRIDSKTDIESDDFDIEHLAEALEDEFGTIPNEGWLDEEEFNEVRASGGFKEYDDFEDYNSDCQYPRIYYAGGHYGLIVNMVTGEVGSDATLPPQKEEVNND